MVSEPLEPAWADFANTQTSLENRRHIDARYWGLEEALSESIPSGSSNTSRKFSTMRDNRAKKHRRRQQLLGTAAHTRPKHIEPVAQADAERKDLLEVCQRELDDLERAVFAGLAADLSYQEIASANGLGVGQLKSRIHRTRQRLSSHQSLVLV